MTARRVVLALSVLLLGLALGVSRLDPAWRLRAAPSAPGPATRALPPVFIFILDAHASLGEIGRLEGGADLAGRLRSSYERNGFTLYPNAYANFQETILSVPSILDFELAPFPGAVGANYLALPRNRFFERLRAGGYRLAVFQGTYIDFARTEGAAVAEASVYEASSPRFLAGSGVGAADAVRLLLRHLSPRFGALPSFYGPLTLAPVLAALEADRSRGGADRAYLAHLMAPHAPFVYAADCRPKPLASWVEELCVDCGERERKAAYRAYLEQVECTHAKLDEFFVALKRAGAYDDSCVVLFGDHGPNIRAANASAPTDDERRLNFSSFLAVKPGACEALRRPAAPSADAEKPTAELLNAWVRAVPPGSFSSPEYRKRHDRIRWE